MSHPLLRVVCLFATGVLLGFWGGHQSGWILGSLLVLAVAGAGWKRWRPLTCPALLILAGCANCTLHTRIWSEDDLRRLISEQPLLADVRGELVETPRVIQQVRDEDIRFRTMAEVAVNEIKTHRGSWEKASGRLAVSSSGTLDPVFYQGQQVEVKGVLSVPEGPRAEGLFDYATYLKQRGIYFQLRAGGTNDWSIGPDGTSVVPFTDRFIQWARRTLARGLPQDDPATGLLQAMTLGWKTALTDEVEEPFMKSGTMHIFAISGLHIALIGGIVLAVLRLHRLPRGFCGLLLIPLLWFYTAATGWQASAVRATVMMTVILGGWSLRRPSNLLNSVATAALLILIIDPRQLFHASFQLSFAVVLSLSLVLPPLQAAALRALEPDPLLPSALVPPWKRWLGAPTRWLLLMAATSLAAWIGSLPLTAHYFHLFSPATLLANLLLVPCATAALASAIASLATGAWWPWMSEVFNHGAWFWMHGMMNLSRSVSELPGAYRYVASPAPGLLTIYYGTLLTLAFGWIKGARLKWFLGGSGLAMVGLLFWQIHARHQAASLTVLPLNGGLAVSVKMPGTNLPLLVDCGNTNASEAVLVPFLHAQGVNKIGALLLTHGDVRHVGSAALIVEKFHPPSVGISDVEFRSSAYRNLVDEALPSLVQVASLNQGDHFDGWTVLYPQAGLKVSRADEGVLALRGTVLGTRVLLLSDLDRTGQRRLLDQTAPEALRADIVITGLPGEGEPLIRDLLRAIQPDLILVGDDEWPSSRRAPQALLARLAETAPVLSTREQGAVKVEFTGAGWHALNATGVLLAKSAQTSGKPEP